MKRILFLIIIISLQLACKSRKVAVSSFNETAQATTATTATATITQTQTSETKAGSLTIKDSSREVLQREGLEFETDSSVTYNTATGDIKFKPKGTTRFNKASHSKATGHSTNKDTSTVNVTTNNKMVVATKAKGKVTTSASGKTKDVDSDLPWSVVIGVGLCLGLLACAILKFSPFRS